MQTPLFSIIVPIYKTEKFLRQCVDSILNQTYSDFQVILVDDGSPDGSGAICDEYACRDHRVKVIHKENGGQCNARKAALAECSGEYVVCVDSDDYIAPDHLAHFAEVIRTHAPDVVLFSATQFSAYDRAPMQMLLPAGLYINERINEIRQNLICAENLCQKIQYAVWAAVVKRSLFEIYQRPVPAHFRRGEDVALTVPLLAECDSVYVLDYYGYFYRNNPESIMNTFRHDEVQHMKELASYLQSRLDVTYYGKIDLYVATHYFDFLDRAMLTMSYGEYRNLVRQTLDKELFGYLDRAKCEGNRMWQIVFLLMRCKMFDALWILRKIRKRK